MRKWPSAFSQYNRLSTLRVSTSGTILYENCSRSPIPWNAISTQESEHSSTEGCKRQGDRPHRPCYPCGSTDVHPTDSSTLCLCPFCHNPTLHHYRLPSVTTTVTKEKIPCELPRMSIPRTPVNKGKRKGNSPKFGCPGMQRAGPSAPPLQSEAIRT